MSDEWSDTDEWPLPRYTGSSKVPATFHPSETPTVTSGPEWRDRGLIIAAQQTRIAQLEAQIARVEGLHMRGWATTSDEVWGTNPQCEEDNLPWPCPTVEALS